MEKPWLQPEAIAQVQLILDNYCHWFKEELIPRNVAPVEQARVLFSAPFVVLSHNTQADPIYNYGNNTALTLWERSWDELLVMPSSQSAAPTAEIQNARNQLLQNSREMGYITDYSGVRYSKNGRRIRIKNVKVWDLLDISEQYRGQAAVFSKWTFLD